MDSLTQVVLGGTVAYSVLGNKLGRKSLLIGAVLGTLPDLDVLINFGSEIENFVYHRSFSHSLIIQLLLSPLFAWLLLKMSWAKGVSQRRWTVAIFLILSTHVLLDSFTVYGTQLLWPLLTYPFGISSIFIIDPAYTVPLLISFIALCFVRFKPYAQHINICALIVSSLYLSWSLLAKWHINDKVHQALQNQNIAFTHFESTPTALNTLLWRAVAITEQGHYEIYASVFDVIENIDIDFYPTTNALLTQFETEKPITLLQNFTKGLYGVYQQDEKLIMSDLRMGQESYYVFSFVVAQQRNQQWVTGGYQKLNNRLPLDKLELIFSRITDPSVDLSAKATD
ncbi:metal-dependent hydrolase [Pseudoalteromonas shioyasakiensis]|uniref:metal-dependent hydrolase n=1 Tax=Pseudoalteromonas shioyasakiensis TaxID=1190813 RepID=UPI00211797B1|nr:metal-dependent hydrolase [Pseudoalteromonas shioyasakiensis]MCQ8878040.1 metal-dependent hydrolase [Pseudoalteromonas shioyasakiensis]